MCSLGERRLVDGGREGRKGMLIEALQAPFLACPCMGAPTRRSLAAGDGPNRARKQAFLPRRRGAARRF
jgi:hypothetical protein